MTAARLALLAAGGSAALLLAALGSQYLGGLDPCKLCIQQRWPHAAAIAAGGLFLVLPSVLILLAGAAAAAVTSGIGLYHAGIEQGWWLGPDSCTAGGAPLGYEALLAAPVTRCDDIAFAFAGISMAGWNAVLSAALALLWLAAAMAWFRGRRPG